MQKLDYRILTQIDRSQLEARLLNLVHSDGYKKIRVHIFDRSFDRRIRLSHESFPNYLRLNINITLNKNLVFSSRADVSTEHSMDAWNEVSGAFGVVHDYIQNFMHGTEVENE